ncbi:MAG: hypothetical protein V4736_06640 [Bdellovibrionota bacterium]
MFKSAKKFSTKMLKSQAGQGLLEYMLLVVVVVAIGVIFKGKITSAFNTQMESFQGKIEEFNAQ